MIVLDTDVLSLLHENAGVLAIRVRARIARLPPGETVWTTVITYEEQFRGWMRYIGNARNPGEVRKGYQLLFTHFEQYQKTQVLPFDDRSADLALDLRKMHRRMGIMDLRIAAIALRNNALLVTRNMGDFQGIPGLKVEDWTSPQ